MQKENLIKEASLARQKAYAPYSKFKVGAALETEDGRVFTGCNVENASYGLTNCAERTAIFKAISEGASKIKRIAIVGDLNEPLSPCGACRQVLAEFCDEDSWVLMANLEGQLLEKKIGDLLPLSFSKKNLEEPFE